MKQMIWVGRFESKRALEAYLDQTEFFAWCDAYGEENPRLAAPFCQELHIDTYDDDFLLLKFAPSGGSELVSLLPADSGAVLRALDEQGITDANAAVIYTCRAGISPEKAGQTTSVTYLGCFDATADPDEKRDPAAGVRHMIWAGTTAQSREEFMTYFDQEAYLEQLRAYRAGQRKKRPDARLRCRFCQDLQLPFYHPEQLTVHLTDKPVGMLELIRSVYPAPEISDAYFEELLDKYGFDRTGNCIFMYLPNGFRDQKRDQKVFILKPQWKGCRGIPESHIDELESYNGCRYLQAFVRE